MIAHVGGVPSPREFRLPSVHSAVGAPRPHQAERSREAPRCVYLYSDTYKSNVAVKMKPRGSMIREA